MCCRQVRVYIDCVQKGVGTTSGGALLGSSESFAGGDEGSYLEPSSNTVPVGTVQGAWPGLDGSESMIKIYTSLDVPTLFAPWTPAHFECPGFCSPAEAAACDVRHPPRPCLASPSTPLSRQNLT